MAEPARKITALSFTYSSLKKLLGLSDKHQSSAGDDEFRVGEYRVDYTMPSREELKATDHELEKLFENSKTISVNK
jgi:hypothetical protein